MLKFCFFVLIQNKICKKTRTVILQTDIVPTQLLNTLRNQQETLLVRASSAWKSNLI